MFSILFRFWPCKEMLKSSLPFVKNAASLFFIPIYTLYFLLEGWLGHIDFGVPYTLHEDLYHYSQIQYISIPLRYSI
jgi:hypothetical protein